MKRKRSESEDDDDAEQLAQMDQFLNDNNEEDTALDHSPHDAPQTSATVSDSQQQEEEEGGSPSASSSAETLMRVTFTELTGTIPIKEAPILGSFPTAVAFSPHNVLSLATGERITFSVHHPLEKQLIVRTQSNISVQRWAPLQLRGRYPSTALLAVSEEKIRCAVSRH
jgi:hypothetical protein